MAELLPCPFCGASLVAYSESFPGGRTKRHSAAELDTLGTMTCPTTGCPSSFSVIITDNEDEAAAWNRRAALPSAAGEVVEKLRPNWKHDEAASYAVSALRAFGHAGLAEDLSREIAENNARKSEAADLIVSLDHECQASMRTIADERARAEAAESRLSQALEALRPFAEEGSEDDGSERHEFIMEEDSALISGTGWLNYALTVGDFRRARALLTPAEEGR